MCILFHSLVNIEDISNYKLVNIIGKILAEYVNAISLVKLLPFHSFVVKTEFPLKRATLKET